MPVPISDSDEEEPLDLARSPSFATSARLASQTLANAEAQHERLDAERQQKGGCSAFVIESLTLQKGALPVVLAVAVWQFGFTCWYHWYNKFGFPQAFYYAAQSVRSRRCSAGPVCLTGAPDWLFAGLQRRLRRAHGEVRDGHPRLRHTVRRGLRLRG